MPLEHTSTQKTSQQKEKWKDELFGSAHLYFTTATFQYGSFQKVEKLLRLCCFPIGTNQADHFKANQLIT